MSVNFENLEQNMVKITFSVSPEDFEAACERAYQKNKSKISIQGFRKGKAPRKMIERMYGKGVFYEDAINDVLPDAYEAAVKETGLDIVSRPEIDIEDIKDGEPVVFTAVAAKKPEVTLGQYKGVEIDKLTAEVSDSEIDAEIENERKKNAREITVEDRAVEDGDLVTIDFRGTVDGVAFDGGTAEDYELEIGSHSFVDDFEEQIIGHNLGDEFDVNVTFPHEYAEELADKDAVFGVKVKKIVVKELPELDDEFASEVSEFDTFDEYKESVKKSILERKEESLKTERENMAVDKAVANAQMEIPDAMIDSQCEDLMNEYEQQMASQGISLSQYLQWTGMDEVKFRESLKPQSLMRIQSRLVLEAIAKAEGLTVSDEEVEAELQKMADNYGMELETIKNYMADALDQMKEDLAVQKAISLIAENAVEVEPAEEETADEEPAAEE